MPARGIQWVPVTNSLGENPWLRNSSARDRHESIPGTRTNEWNGSIGAYLDALSAVF